MEYIIGILVALLGAVFVYKKKADNAMLDAKLGRTQGRDDVLKDEQAEVEKQLSELDKGITDMQVERERREREKRNKTALERAEDWKE